ncbi:MAG: MOSC domain-containing protein [Myxococcaceae bacterium]|nr:MOSC domain-containing protein [Myxococcaceae bacterium]
MTMRITSLFCYPVKGLRGVATAALQFGPRGPLHDRHWMVVGPDDRFLSQRSTPRMATLNAALTGAALVLSTDDGQRLDVPLDAGVTPRDVVIWRDTVRALDCGDAPARWLTERLGQACRLVHLPPDTVRLLDPKFSPRADAQTGFADAYPVLVTNAASLEALNRDLPRPLGMDRFRPNVVLDGAPAWAEDGWRVLQAGAVTFDLVKPCARCAVITTDQRTGETPDGPAPLATLARLHTLPPFGAIFGQNAVHRGPGTLRLGDEVAVLESQPTATP